MTQSTAPDDCDGMLGARCRSVDRGGTQVVDRTRWKVWQACEATLAGDWLSSEAESEHKRSRAANRGRAQSFVASPVCAGRYRSIEGWQASCSSGGVAAKRGPKLGCSGMGSRRRARGRQSRRVIRRPWSAIMRCPRAQRWHAVPSVLRQRGRARPWFRRGANATMCQWQLVCMVRGASVFLR